MRLKNIIFDLGGVLIDIDYERTKITFENLGIENFDTRFSQFTSDALFADLEQGLITEVEFYTAIQKLNPQLSIHQITDAWNTMLLQWRTASLQFIKNNLPSNFNLFLLSNTNQIHKTAFDKTLESATGWSNSIDFLFNKAYWSHKIKLRKPTAEVFEYVLNNAQINAGETLFIDDSTNNIETAKQLGLQTHLLLPHETIETLAALQ